MKRPWSCALVVAGLVLVPLDAARAAQPGAPPGVSHELNASEQAPVRLLVLDTTLEFSARVRGQVSDLDLLLVVEAASAALGTDDDLAARAARHDADVVAWLGAAPPGEAEGTAVYLWLAAQPAVRARRVGPLLSPVESDEHSATLEAAALMVRSAVRAVVFERARTTLAAAAAPAVAVAPQEPPASAPALDRAPVEVSAPAAGTRRWAARGGVSWTLDGVGEGGAWAASAGFALRLGAFGVGVVGSVGMPTSLHLPDVTLELQRNTLALELSWEIYSEGPLALRPALVAGAGWVSREARASSTDIQTTVGRSVLGAFAGADAALELALSPVLRLALSPGLRWSAHTERYVLQTQGAELYAAEATRLSASVGLSLGALF
jgi:hypothetical protein